MEPLIYNASDHTLWFALRANRECVFVSPTDTVYGLGTLFANTAGMERILGLKNRENQSCIVLARNIDEVLELAKLSAVQEIIVKKYWPGPISFVVPSKKFPGTTLAVRVPEHDLLSRLMLTLGGPILSTSCNRHGQPPVGSIAEAVELFGDQVDFYIDGGPQQNTLASTLVDLTTSVPTVLRQGTKPFP